MDFSELNAALTGLGRTPIRPPAELDYMTMVLADPWRVVEQHANGTVETRFANEDALCRWVLTHALVGRPAPHADQPMPPDLPTHPDTAAQDAVVRWGRDRPPTLRWRRRLRPHSYVLARGSGIIVVFDTSSLYRHGPAGAVHLAAVDAVTGQLLWTRPARHRWRIDVSGEVVLAAGEDDFVAVDARSGELLSQHARDPNSHFLAYDPASEVVAICDYQKGRVVAVNVRTGATVWQDSELVMAPVLAYQGVPRVSRLLYPHAGEGRIIVDSIRLVDGSRQPLFDVPEPPAYRRTKLYIVADMLTEDTSGGYLIVRGDYLGAIDSYSSARGNLVLVPNDGPSREWSGFRAESLDVDHYVLLPRLLHKARPRMMTPDGRTVWRIRAKLNRPRRAGNVTLGQLYRPNNVIAVSDRGKKLWSAPGVLRVVDEGVMCTDDTGYDLATGRRLWTSPFIEHHPGRSQWYHPDDGCFLIETDGELSVYG